MILILEHRVPLGPQNHTKNPLRKPQKSRNRTNIPKRFLADLDLLGLWKVLERGCRMKNGEEGEEEDQRRMLGFEDEPELSHRIPIHGKFSGECWKFCDPKNA